MTNDEKYAEDKDEFHVLLFDCWLWRKNSVSGEKEKLSHVLINSPVY